MHTSIGKSEDGQALPLVVLLLLVLMGVAAMVLDGGFAYAQRRIAQNAADAAALAGALSLMNGEYRDAVVRQQVTQYAQANGNTAATMAYEDADGNLLADPTNGLVPSNAAALRVTAQRTFPTFFARVVGLPEMTASAEASAAVVPASMPPSLLGLAPLSVPTNFYEVCASVNAACNIWDSQYGREWGIKASQYKALIDLSDGAAGGNMPGNISSWTQYGYQGEVLSDIWLPTVSGDLGNNVAGALRQRIITHPGGVDPDGVVWGSIDMVIWDGYNASNGTIHVALFGRFKVRLTNIAGSMVVGHFMNYIVPGHERGDPGSGTNAGPRIIILNR